MAKQDYACAIDQLSHASIEKIPEPAEAHYLLAFSLHLSGKDLNESVRLYTRSLELSFEPFWIYYNRGGCYVRLGKKTEAAEDLKKARELKPDHQGVLTYLKELGK